MLKTVDTDLARNRISFQSISKIQEAVFRWGKVLHNRNDPRGIFLMQKKILSSRSTIETSFPHIQPFRMPRIAFCA